MDEVVHDIGVPRSSDFIMLFLIQIISVCSLLLCACEADSGLLLESQCTYNSFQVPPHYRGK